jgi:hypothetical protein
MPYCYCWGISLDRFLFKGGLINRIAGALAPWHTKEEDTKRGGKEEDIS